MNNVGRTFHTKVNVPAAPADTPSKRSASPKTQELATHLLAMQRELFSLKQAMTTFEKWEFVHYDKPGVLGWLASFFLLIFPTTRAKFNKIEELNRQCKQLGDKSAPIKPQESAHFPPAVGELVIPTDKESAVSSIHPCAIGKIFPAALPSGELHADTAPLKPTSQPSVTLGSDLIAPSEKQIALETVTNNGLALQNLSAELRADRDIVLAAVDQCGLAIQYADNTCRADKEIVIAAINSQGKSLPAGKLSPKQLNDKEIAMVLLRKEPIQIHALSEALRSDKEIALFALSKKWTTYIYLSPSLKKDPDVILEWKKGMSAKSAP